MSCPHCNQTANLKKLNYAFPMMSAPENIIMKEQGQQMTCVWAWEVTAPMSPARNKDREVGGDAHMVRFSIYKFGTCTPMVHS